MHLSTVINASFLCLFNVALMIAGIFFNSVVIISLWRSSQLRKKLCYFMILVLSCFDLAVVAILHPFHISSISVALGVASLIGLKAGSGESGRWSWFVGPDTWVMFTWLVSCRLVMRHEVFLGANHRDRFKIWMYDVQYCTYLFQSERSM